MRFIFKGTLKAFSNIRSDQGAVKGYDITCFFCELTLI